MDRERILGILREHESELKAAGLVHLRLFGSVARGDNSPQSDVDILAEYGDAVDLFHLMSIQDRLKDLLGKEVHLTSARTLKKTVAKHALKDALDAF